MGHKVHPTGFRIGITQDWRAKWYADKHYAEFLHEDLKLRQAIGSKYAEAGISLVVIERQSNKVSITIHTSRPGVVIGRGGQRVDEMRHYLEDLVGKRIQLNIQEIRQPELDAYLVARTIAEQIERRIAYRRAIKQAVFRTRQAGAKGIRVSCAGRLGGAEIARRQTIHEGRVPLHTLRADIDYGFTEAHTTLGRIGIKVWLYKGDILPEPKGLEVAEVPAEVAESSSVEAEPSAVAEPAETAVPVAEESPEAAPEAKPAEKPPKTRARKTTRAEPSAVAKPAETAAPVAEESPEAAPEAKPAEKPPKTRARKTTRVEPSAVAEPAETAAPVAEESPETAPEAKPAAEKPPKTRARKTTRVEPSAVAEPAETAVPVVEESPETAPEAKPAEKPPKTRARKTTRAKPSAVAEPAVEKEETDATTQAGEVPQGS